MEIILASASPRRRELLGSMGIRDFRIVKPDFEEERVQAPSPAALVEALSAGKAAAVVPEHPQALIIAADTVVVLESRVLGKPTDKADAAAMLTALSGKRHQVYTGFTVRRENRIVTQHEVTSVTFRPLSPQEIGHYIDTGEPMDKAGAYGIQGVGSLLVEGVEGDYFNVMGLPVCRLGQILKEFGIDCLARCAR